MNNNQEIVNKVLELLGQLNTTSKEDNLALKIKNQHNISTETISNLLAVPYSTYNDWCRTSDTTASAATLLKLLNKYPFIVVELLNNPSLLD